MLQCCAFFFFFFTNWFIQEKIVYLFLSHLLIQTTMLQKWYPHIVLTSSFFAFCRHDRYTQQQCVHACDSRHRGLCPFPCPLPQVSQPDEKSGWHQSERPHTTPDIFAWASSEQTKVNRATTSVPSNVALVFLIAGNSNSKRKVCCWFLEAFFWWYITTYQISNREITVHTKGFRNTLTSQRKLLHSTKYSKASQEEKRKGDEIITK